MKDEGGRMKHTSPHFTILHLYDRLMASLLPSAF